MKDFWVPLSQRKPKIGERVWIWVLSEATIEFAEYLGAKGGWLAEHSCGAFKVSLEDGKYWTRSIPGPEKTK